MLFYIVGYLVNNAQTFGAFLLKVISMSFFLSEKQKLWTWFVIFITGDWARVMVEMSPNLL